jgi:hypothetical protein
VGKAPPHLLPSRKAKLWYLTHLTLGLHPADLVRRPPPQFDALDPGGAVARVPDADVLCDAAALLRGEGAACLGSELELVALLRGVRFCFLLFLECFLSR